MRNWLEPPEPREYPECISCGSTNYEKAYFDGKRVVACSDCCVELEADELVNELDEISRSKYEEDQFEFMREGMFENG